MSIVLNALTSLALMAAPVQAEPTVSPADRFCDPEAARIMILGAYHMSNPGLDQNNVNADSVLSERRQAEIADLVNSLARYAPTRVMVEHPRSDGQLQRNYTAFREGRYTLTHNETNQIGFRLAAQANLDRVHPIDFPMFMSGLRPDEIDGSLPARPAPPPPDPSAPPPAAPAPPELSEEDRLLRSMTVSQYMRRENDLEALARNHSGYMNLFDFNDQNPAIYERSDRLVNWYRRNVRMFANIARHSRPGDRVFVLVGAGHLHHFRDFAIASPRFCLVEPFDYLPA